MVIGACDAIGKEFREEFDSSTGPCSCPIVSFADIVWKKAG